MVTVYTTLETASR